MAADNIIWGFGGVKFETDDYTATFDGARGNLIWQLVRRKYTNINDNIRTINVGWRLRIKVSNIYATSSSEFEQLQNLMLILNKGKNITIYPRNDDTITTNISYDCTLDSSVNLDDIHATKIGQKIELEFFDPNIYESIQDLDVCSGVVETVYVDDSDDTYIDDEENSYISDN